MTPYKKAVDTNGNIVALLHHDIDRVIILYPVNKTNGEGVEVDIRQCASIEEAMVNFIGLKKVTDAEVEEYKETLFKIW